MNDYYNYRQWAEDAEQDKEWDRAAEFWKLAASKCFRPSPLSAQCESNSKRCMDVFNSKPQQRHRTGKRTIRGEDRKGIVIMEFCPPNSINLRHKGRRKRFYTTIEAVFDFAMRSEAQRIRDEKAKQRKLKRKS